MISKQSIITHREREAFWPSLTTPPRPLQQEGEVVQATLAPESLSSVGSQMCSDMDAFCDRIQKRLSPLPHPKGGT